MCSKHSVPVIYDRTPQNPDEAAVEAAAALYSANDCDGVIALGGGSPIDLGKGVALLAGMAVRSSNTP